MGIHCDASAPGCVASTCGKCSSGSRSLMLRLVSFVRKQKFASALTVSARCGGARLPSKSGLRRWRCAAALSHNFRTRACVPAVASALDVAGSRVCRPRCGANLPRLGLNFSSSVVLLVQLCLGIGVVYFQAVHSPKHVRLERQAGSPVLGFAHSRQHVEHGIEPCPDAPAREVAGLHTQSVDRRANMLISLTMRGLHSTPVNSPALTSVVWVDMKALNSSFHLGSDSLRSDA